MTDFGNEYQRNLIATVVHELKTPIAAVRGFIELVEQVGPLTPTQTHYLERATGGLRRMELLIASLLEMARLDTDVTLDLKECDLQALIEDAVEIIQGVAHKRSIQIEYHVEDSARYVMADSGLLRQVITNLIGNAVKYNRSEGKVAVSARVEDESVRVDVRDTGIGIAADDLERVFEPFTRARTGERIEGSGLGLWIAETVVQKHGGRIWVQSVPGEGSMFSFTLPLQTAAREVSDSVEDSKQETASGLSADAPDELI
jgi:signal transduction histidine kinase